MVVGGGAAAADKVAYLADFGVSITVLIEPSSGIAPFVRELAESKQIEVQQEPYEASFLEGHSFVVVATGDRARDRLIAADAKALGAIVNVVDDPEVCDVFAVGYVRRGPVSIAVSTGGRSPAFTAALREHLDETIEVEIQEHFEWFARWREQVRLAVLGSEARECLWRELRALGLYGVLRTAGPDAASDLVVKAIRRYTQDGPNS